MRVCLLGMFFILLSSDINGQTDSIKKVVSNHILIKALDSISNDLRNKKVTEIISFGMFRYVNPYGVVIWKDENGFKAMKLCQRNNEIKKKNLKSSVIKSFVNSYILSDKCDVFEILQGDKKAYISHDLSMYLKRQTEAVKKEVYFTYSTYLSYKDSCIEGLKYLVSL